MWKMMVNAVSSLTTIILFVLLIVTLFVVISTKASGGEPAIFGYQFKTVLSGSMEPGIQTSSIISIKPEADPAQLKKGDIITYRTSDDILVTHRIDQIETAGQQFITKGDNNNAPDTNPVLAENIVGKYTGFTLPYAGYVVNFANSRQGAALLLILPGILLLVYSSVTIWRTLRMIDVSMKIESPNCKDKNKSSDFL